MAQPPGQWCVYLVECADGTLYAGISNDLARRLQQHNDGSGARYTRSRRPVSLVYAEPAADRSSASRREYELKQLPRAHKLRLLAHWQAATPE